MKAASRPAALTPRALRAFNALTPEAQTNVLFWLGAFSHPRIPISRLLGTEAQRQAVREQAAALKAERLERERKERARIGIQQQLQRLHNRAQLRNSRRGYLTPAAERRYDALHAKLNAIDGIGGAR